MLQDVKSWASGWLHGLLANLPIFLLLLIQTGLYAPLWTASNTDPSTLPLWLPGPAGIRLNVHPGASPSLSILLLPLTLRLPRPSPCIPSASLCVIRAASCSHTCIYRLTAGPGGLRGHQPLQGCSMAKIVLVQSRLFSPCAAFWSHLWAHGQSVRTSRSSMIHTEISTPAFSCHGFLMGHPWTSQNLREAA